MMNIPVYDMIGIGFGPANLAIAIAMDEHQPANGEQLLSCFIEKQAGFEWHGGMLLSNTHLQVSFMKDLVTLRNPTSRYSFVNYLHQKKRLESFINLGSFYPSRLEYNDYMHWAAGTFGDRVHYGEEVIAIEPVEENGKVDWLTVRSRSADGVLKERRARSIIIGIGGRPNIPDIFKPYRDHPGLIHSSEYKTHADRFAGPASRLAVVGAGQSAAEIFRDLMDRHPAAKVDLISRARALHPADDSPFVNEIFNPEFIDDFYRTPEPERQSMIRSFNQTNYSVVDLDLIEDIYARLYEQKVIGDPRHAFLPRHQITAIETADHKVSMALLDKSSGTQSWTTYDGVVLATGFHRQGHQSLLKDLTPWMAAEKADRSYRLPMVANCTARVFLQGCCEDTHGLADTLLSVLAVRSDEVVASLYADSHSETRLRHTG